MLHHASQHQLTQRMNRIDSTFSISAINDRERAGLGKIFRKLKQIPFNTQPIPFVYIDLNQTEVFRLVMYLTPGVHF